MHSHKIRSKSTLNSNISHWLIYNQCKLHLIAVVDMAGLVTRLFPQLFSRAASVLFYLCGLLLQEMVCSSQSGIATGGRVRSCPLN